MSKNIGIRFAEPADLEFLKDNLYIREKMICRKIESKEIIIADKETVPVGFLQLEYLWSLVPYIALIGVLPEHRQEGIGTGMLRFAGSFLRDEGHQMIYSSSQADEPEPQAWHRHAGFEECGVIAGINDGIGEIFFRRRI
ncbi:MAG: GNAT family N-acetyltransferase [Pyrinomonadaceae bacterium]